MSIRDLEEAVKLWFRMDRRRQLRKQTTNINVWSLGNEEVRSVVWCYCFPVLILLQVEEATSQPSLNIATKIVVRMEGCFTF